MAQEAGSRETALPAFILYLPSFWNFLQKATKEEAELIIGIYLGKLELSAGLEPTDCIINDSLSEDSKVVDRVLYK